MWSKSKHAAAFAADCLFRGSLEGNQISQYIIRYNINFFL